MHGEVRGLCQTAGMTGPETGSTGRHARADLCFLLAWVPYALLVRHLWFVSDDAFITFRYARNWASGIGLRYNPVESPPVEGYSNFLWMLVCTVLEMLRIPPEIGAPTLSFLAGSYLLWRVFRHIRGPLGGSLPSAVAGALLLGLAPPFACWSSSGLETLPFALSLFLAWELLVRAGDELSPWKGALALLAACLLRVEGPAWAALIGLLALAGRSREQRIGILRALGVAAGLFALYYGIKSVWFQAWVANTAVAKSELSGRGLWRGFCYVLVFYLTFPGLLAMAAGFAQSTRGWRLRRDLSAPLLVVAFAAYAVLVGGDFMAMGRFLVPVLPFLALAGAAGLEALIGRRSRIMAGIALVGVLGVNLLPAWDLHVVPEAWRAPFHFRWNGPRYESEYVVWQKERAQVEVLRQVGEGLARYARPGDRLVGGAIGVIGYVSGLQVLDQFGLVTPEVARLPVAPEKLRSPGHDHKVEIWYFLKDNPDLMHAALVLGRDLRSMLGPFIGDMNRRSVSGQYAIDLLPMEGEGVRHLLVIRRIVDGDTPEAAWNRLDLKLKAIEAGGSGAEEVDGP